MATEEKTEVVENPPEEKPDHAVALEFLKTQESAAETAKADDKPADAEKTPEPEAEAAAETPEPEKPKPGLPDKVIQAVRQDQTAVLRELQKLNERFEKRGTGPNEQEAAKIVRLEAKAKANLERFTEAGSDSFEATPELAKASIEQDERLTKLERDNRLLHLKLVVNEQWVEEERKRAEQGIKNPREIWDKCHSDLWPEFQDAFTLMASVDENKANEWFQKQVQKLYDKRVDDAAASIKAKATTKPIPPLPTARVGAKQATPGATRVSDVGTRSSELTNGIPDEAEQLAQMVALYTQANAKR